MGWAGPGPNPSLMNSADIAEYNNKYYLVHADRFLNFLWVYQLKKIKRRVFSREVKKHFCLPNILSIC